MTNYAKIAAYYLHLVPTSDLKGFRIFANRSTRVAEVYGSKFQPGWDLTPTVLYELPTMGSLTATALYELAAPSTPQEIRDRVETEISRSPKISRKKFNRQNRLCWLIV